MSFPPIPPDTRAIGQFGHILDHNEISDSLAALQAAVTTLQGAIAGSVIPSSIQNGNYTLALTDLGTVVEVNSAGAVTVTIPPSSQVAFPVGAIVNICQTGAGTVTVAAGTGVTLLGASLSTAAQYAYVGLRQRALNTWIAGLFS